MKRDKITTDNIRQVQRIVKRISGVTSYDFLFTLISQYVDLVNETPDICKVKDGILISSSPSSNLRRYWQLFEEISGSSPYKTDFPFGTMWDLRYGVSGRHNKKLRHIQLSLLKLGKRLVKADKTIIDLDVPEPLTIAYIDSPVVEVSDILVDDLETYVQFLEFWHNNSYSMISPVTDNKIEQNTLVEMSPSVDRVFPGLYDVSLSPRLAIRDHRNGIAGEWKCSKRGKPRPHALLWYAAVKFDEYRNKQEALKQNNPGYKPLACLEIPFKDIIHDCIKDKHYCSFGLPEYYDDTRVVQNTFDNLKKLIKFLDDEICIQTKEKKIKFFIKKLRISD